MAAAFVHHTSDDLRAYTDPDRYILLFCRQLSSLHMQILPKLQMIVCIVTRDEL